MDPGRAPIDPHSHPFVSSITFLVQDVPNGFRGRRRLKAWMDQVARGHRRTLGRLCFVLMSDEALLEFNVKYLNHNDLTDVITFPGSGAAGISGDILISYDRVRDNAHQLGLSAQEELHRVMVHGVLHLIGYEDKDPASRNRMREQEDLWLGRLSLIS